MSESNEKQEKFFGAYVDRDAVLRLARWAEGTAWVVLTVYLLAWAGQVLMFFAQLFNGMFFQKGFTFLDMFNIFLPYFQQPLPGIFYFFGLQALSKAILILLDVEDNTRRAARK